MHFPSTTPYAPTTLTQMSLRNVRRCIMGNQKPHIEKDRQYYDQKKIYKRTNNTITKRKYTKGQTILSPKENIQKDKQRSSKHYTEN
jgi:hypothetical protein